MLDDDFVMSEDDSEERRVSEPYHGQPMGREQSRASWR